jgi:plastocyanin
MVRRAGRSETVSAGDSGRDEETRMAKDLKPGDKVSWDTSQGKTHGVVEKKQTSRTQIKGHTVAASKDDPQYIVKSAKSGKKAAHKPEELKKTT